MTRRFQARFTNGVLIPSEKVELPANTMLTVTVDESQPALNHGEIPRFDASREPMPKGGVELVDWWARYALPVDPTMGDKLARSKSYGFYEEPDDDA